MRWNEKAKPRHWDTRVRSGFLLVPSCLNGEWRWLERATWEEHYTKTDIGGYWTEFRWIEPSEVEPIPYRVTPAGRAALRGES